MRGIGFRSLTEALDTTTAQGRPVFHMFGALAEFERSLIRERTQARLAAARRIGRTGGRPPKPTDEDIEAAKALLANPDIGVTQIAHLRRRAIGTSQPREPRIPQPFESGSSTPSANAKTDDGLILPRSKLFSRMRAPETLGEARARSAA